MIKKIFIIGIVALMLVSAVSAVDPDPTNPDYWNNIDNWENVDPNTVTQCIENTDCLNNVDWSKFDPKVLTPKVILGLQEVGTLSKLSADQLNQAISSYAEKSNFMVIDPAALNQDKVKFEMQSGQLVIVDSGNRRFDITAISDRADRMGVNADGKVIIVGAEDLILDIDGNEVTFNGNVVMGDMFECIEGACSVEGNDIRFRYQGNEIHLTGDPAKISVYPNGMLSEIDGILKEPIDKLSAGNCKSPSIDEPCFGFSNLPAGAEIKFGEGELNSLEKAGGAKVAYAYSSTDFVEIEMNDKSKMSIMNNEVEANNAKLTKFKGDNKAFEIEGGHFKFDTEEERARVYGPKTEFRGSSSSREDINVRNSGSLNGVTDIYTDSSKAPEDLTQNEVNAVVIQQDKVHLVSVNNYNTEVQFGEDTVSTKWRGSDVTITRQGERNNIDVSVWAVPEIEGIGGLTDYKAAVISHQEQGGEEVRFNVRSNREGEVSIVEAGATGNSYDYDNLGISSNAGAGSFTISANDLEGKSGQLMAVSDNERVLFDVDRSDPESQRYDVKILGSSFGLSLNNPDVMNTVAEVLEANGMEYITDNMYYKGDKIDFSGMELDTSKPEETAQPSESAGQEPGQAEKKPEAPKNDVEYTIQNGDTLWYIAGQYYGKFSLDPSNLVGADGNPCGSSVTKTCLPKEIWQIANRNGMSNPNLIYTGDKIIIPNAPAQGTEAMKDRESNVDAVTKSQPAGTEPSRDAPNNRGASARPTALNDKEAADLFNQLPKEAQDKLKSRGEIVGTDSGSRYAAESVRNSDGTISYRIVQKNGDLTSADRRWLTSSDEWSSGGYSLADNSQQGTKMSAEARKRAPTPTPLSNPPSNPNNPPNPAEKPQTEKTPADTGTSESAPATPSGPVTYPNPLAEENRATTWDDPLDNVPNPDGTDRNAEQASRSTESTASNSGETTTPLSNPPTIHTDPLAPETPPATQTDPLDADTTGN